MDIGRMAFFADPTGAVFGIWQPKSSSRPLVSTSPTRCGWRNEVLTPYADANKRVLRPRRCSAGIGASARL